MENTLNKVQLANGIAVSSRVRLARNAADIPFPNKGLDVKSAENLVNQVYSVMGKIGKFNIYRMSSVTADEAQALVEKHLVSNDLIKQRSGAAIVNDEETVSVMVNEEDHIRAQCIQKGLNLIGAYSVINHIDDLLSEKIHIAFDGELGYLTSCPTNLGTGMRASVMMFLPALTIGGTVSSIINALSKIGLTVRGVYGEGSAAAGYLYQVSNQVSLGVSEQDILRDVEAAVLKICEAERLARNNLMEKSNLEIRDRVMRAYGILTNCAKVDSSEFMRLIADVKLGAYLKLLNISDMEAVDQMVSRVQPANIILASGRKLNATERDVFRADTVRKVLTQLTAPKQK